MQSLAPRFIKFPVSNEEITDVKRKFHDLAGFPNVVGAVDGTHVSIARPVENEEVYFNRKNYHSINCQMICDAEMRFTNVVAKWPGATHDSHMWNECSVKRMFENGTPASGWLLGDSGYAQKPCMMVPFLRPASRAETRYNDAHAQTRNVVERAFGVWKNRFRAVHFKGTGPLNTSPERACVVIVATAVLHNIAIMRKTPEPPANDNPGNEPAGAPPPVVVGADAEGAQVRRRLVEARFT